jgi:hypothetical protein
VLGWTFLVVLATFIALKGKNYYVAPIYPVLFTAGAVGFERVTHARFRWSRTAHVAAVVVVGALLTPMVCPVLSAENYLRYQALLHITPPRAERQNNGPLSQYFADEFGWSEMVRQVAQVYNNLPPDQRARTAIFCND